MPRWAHSYEVELGAQSCKTLHHRIGRTVNPFTWRARSGGDRRNLDDCDSAGGANQTGVIVARIDPHDRASGRPAALRQVQVTLVVEGQALDRQRAAEYERPCNPSGLAFVPDGRLYVTGVGAAGDQIAAVAPSDGGSGTPPVATVFATDTPGANGVAFDEEGNLYASDGGTNQGRVFRVGPFGGAAAVLFRVPPMTNSAGVGRQNQTVQPLASGSPPATQGIVANGLAFDRDGALFVADTARGALWRVELDEDGHVLAPTGCDATFAADTLCFDALFLQHPALDGADGIALDRARNVWVDANERNAIVVVDHSSRVTEFFRNPVGGGSLRNAGPLEFPTSPVLAGRTLCTTSSDGNRRDNAPNSAGEAKPSSPVVGKVSCLDERLDIPGLPLPVR